MNRTGVHLDTDIGGDIDDLCALALLLRRPDVALTGVTTVLEHAGKRAGYARYALRLAGRRDVPVAAGADVDVHRFAIPAGLPPEERYWPEPVPAAPGPVDAALDLLAQSIDRGAIVVAIGPFTNLSLLERRHPGILRRATLCLMGGSVRPAPAGFPRWGLEEDWNVQVDPAAAQHVLDAAHPERVTIVPIEITVQTALRRAYLPALRRAGPLARLIARQAEVFAEDYPNEEQYGHTCSGLPDDTINFQHDPLACAVALGWDGATVETLPLALDMEGKWLRVRVVTGGRPARVVTRVDGPRFNTFWLDTIAGTGDGIGDGTGDGDAVRRDRPAR